MKSESKMTGKKQNVIISDRAKQMAETYKNTPLAKMHGSMEKFSKSLQMTIDKQL